MQDSYARMQGRLELSDLETILALVRGGSLAGAAERLRVDASTVFRAVKRIEKEVGETLFERGRQGYRPTELGRTLAAHAERVESQLDEARAVAFRGSTAPSGVLRVTTTDSILHCLLLPALAGFALEYPAIQLELVASNSLANLSQRDADVAIRATRKPPEHLVGTRLRTLRSGVYASREWLARQPGAPDLARADWIALDDSLPDHPSHKWRRQRFPGLAPRIRCNSVMAVAGAIVAGYGIGVTPEFVLGAHPGVVSLTGPVPELETELWALAHPDVRQLQRVKALFDYLRARLPLQEA